MYETADGSGILVVNPSADDIVEPLPTGGSIYIKPYRDPDAHAAFVTWARTASV